MDEDELKNFELLVKRRAFDAFSYQVSPMPPPLALASQGLPIIFGGSAA